MIGIPKRINIQLDANFSEALLDMKEGRADLKYYKVGKIARLLLQEKIKEELYKLDFNLLASVDKPEAALVMIEKLQKQFKFLLEKEKIDKLNNKFNTTIGDVVYTGLINSINSGCLA